VKCGTSTRPVFCLPLCGVETGLAAAGAFAYHAPLAMLAMLYWLRQIPPFVWLAAGVLAVVLGTVAYLILLERKVASWIQDRIGPNRVGPRGLLQPLADGLKMLVKEDYRPPFTDRYLFTLAPALMMAVMIVALAVIPWGGVYESPAMRWRVQIADLDIGAVFVLAVLSLAVYGVVVAGWASDNKYSFLGALRATAQMVSYEVPLGLSLLTVLLMYGTLDLGVIVERQAHMWAGVIPAWNIFCQPAAFVLFLVCMHAEANRAPFDLPEAEQELVGGYHTEYTSMRLGLLLLAEYAGMIVTSAVCAAVFLGGWHMPGLGGPDAARPAVTHSAWVVAARCAVYYAKVLVLIFVFMWVRWSLPRFRFDQLLSLAWRGLVPLSLALLAGTAWVVYVFGAEHRAHMRIGGRMALALLGMNIAVAAGALAVGRMLPARVPNRRLAVPGSRFAAAGMATEAGR